MEIARTAADVRCVVHSWRCAGERVGLVPTMGFFHEGHLALMDASRTQADRTVVSLFVNPTQFGPTEDLAAYPRDEARDAALAEAAGVDLVLAPTVQEMYPAHAATSVRLDALAADLCGASRPHHFPGVALVVTKLFAIVRPDVAFFGRKDAQQLAIVTRLAADLHLGVDVVGCPIVREPSGLALSSRNVYLGADDRARALALSRAVLGAADLVDAGTSAATPLLSAARAVFAAHDVEPEYAELRRLPDLQPAQEARPGTLLAVAATVGNARLIDNVHIDAGGPDRGVRLDGQSLLYAQGK